MVKKELSCDELQQILQVFVKAMGALFIAHFRNHKRLLFFYTGILPSGIVKPDVETVTAGIAIATHVVSIKVR